MEQKKSKIKYLSFGSPLMDCIGDVPQAFIEENHIDLNSSIHMKLEKIPFYHEFITGTQITYVPGGCQFNAMRVFNWMLEKDKDDFVAFLGSIGEDSFGKLYENLLIRENIIPIFESFNNENSGTCLVICNKRDRAHITDLGVSTRIDKEYVERNWHLFKDVKLIYTELFILKSQPEISKKLALLGSENGRIYGFNLPSFYFLETLFNDIYDLIGYADILFTNEDEAEFFVKKMGKETDHTPKKNSEILAKIPKKNINKKRVVIVTCGPEPAWCCEFDFIKNCITYLDSSYVKYVEKEKIIDTNGAGDSFSGGFLSQYIKGNSLKQCMIAGHWAAAEIIQRRGCQLPEDLHYVCEKVEGDLRKTINERLGISNLKKEKNSDSSDSD